MRIKVVTLGLSAAALLGVAFLALTLLRSDQSAATDGDADAAPTDPRARLASKLRGRSVPRFETVTTPEPPPPPPPQLVPPPLAPPPPPPANPQAELRERASKDGFLFQEAGSHAIYVVQGGTKFHIKNPEEFRALGYRGERIEVVPPGSLNFLSDRPPEKILMRERDNPQVYFYENGQKRWVTSPEMLERLGKSWSDVKLVPSGSLSREATGSPIQ